MEPGGEGGGGCARARVRGTPKLALIYTVVLLPTSSLDFRAVFMGLAAFRAARGRRCLAVSTALYYVLGRTRADVECTDLARWLSSNWVYAAYPRTDALLSHQGVLLMHATGGGKRIMTPPVRCRIQLTHRRKRKNLLADNPSRRRRSSIQAACPWIQVPSAVPTSIVQPSPRCSDTVANYVCLPELKALMSAQAAYIKLRSESRMVYTLILPFTSAKRAPRQSLERIGVSVPNTTPQRPKQLRSGHAPSQAIYICYFKLQSFTLQEQQNRTSLSLFYSPLEADLSWRARYNCEQSLGLGSTCTFIRTNILIDSSWRTYGRGMHAELALG
ncbi:hypothetical protein C2E23DRAFT_343573 [Lenzites betulinus]|nr:hypothetical protein C2E23DRAFT_343573 [Lenzites betulinus]